MCTIFTVSRQDSVYFANNEDNQLNEDETFIAFIPSQEIPSNWIYPDKNGFFTNYGFMLVGVRKNNKLLPQGGMNSCGLSYDINGLPSVPFKGNKGKPWKFGFNYFDLLMTAKNIEEVVQHFQTYEQEPHQWGAGQIHFADSRGKAVVIGINENGELGFFYKENQDYLISTNFNLNNRNDSRGFPCRRYEIANRMLENLSEKKQLDFKNCVEILDATKVDYGKNEPKTGTVYSNVFDLVKKEIYLYHLHDFSKVKRFELASELNKIMKVKHKPKYAFEDDAVFERFNFTNMSVYIIKHLFV